MFSKSYSTLVDSTIVEASPINISSVEKDFSLLDESFRVARYLNKQNAEIKEKYFEIKKKRKCQAQYQIYMKMRPTTMKSRLI